MYPSDSAVRTAAYWKVAEEALREVETPALAVIEPILLQNLKHMQTLCENNGVSLRPHAKTHKSPFIAHLQRRYGAKGLTVATVEEAEAFGSVGHSDFLLAFPAVGDRKRARLAKLAGEAQLKFSVDSIDAVASVDLLGRQIGRPVGYYWEVDTGLKRFGTSAGIDTVDALVAAHRYSFASMAGLMSFGGHVYGAASPEDAIRIAANDAETLVKTATLARERGLQLDEISVGTTTGATTLAASHGVTELRSGNYVFNDATQVALGAASIEDCAQVVAATVVSTPSDGRIVIDAGSKAIPKESMTTLSSGYGIVLGHPNLRITRIYEESSVLEPQKDGEPSHLKIGDRLLIVTNHSCSATNLYSNFWLVKENGSLKREAIVARNR